MPPSISFAQFLEGVLDGGLAPRGDSSPQLTAFGTAPSGDLAAPRSRAPAVPRAVHASAVMLEVNGIVALAAPF
jgi:hypothetical protein